MTSAEDEMTDTLKARAGRVIEMHNGHEAAIADQQAAEDELLARVVDAVRPALPTLVGRVEGIPDALRIGARRDGVPPAGPGRGHKTLYLTKFAQWQQITLHANGATGIAELTVAEVLDGWSVHFITQRLAEALEAQERGHLVMRTEQIRGRSARLRALATLLEREV